MDYDTLIQPHVLYFTCLELSERGVDLRTLPESQSVIEPIMQLKHPRISFAQSHNLIERALGLSGDRNLGLAVGSRQGFCATGLVAGGVLACDTVGDALQFGLTYHRLMGSMLELDFFPLEAEGAAIVAKSRNPQSRITRFLVQDHFATLAQILRFVARTDKPFEFVDVTYSRDDASRHNDAFSAATRFLQSENRIVLSKAILDLPLETADPFALSATTLALDELIKQEGEALSFLWHIERIILQSLPVVPSMLDISRQLNTNERSLRRKLGDLGTSFREILDHVREARAMELLLETDLTLDDIASRLGFEDPRSLRRGVKKWTGKSPRDLRARRR